MTDLVSFNFCEIQNVTFGMPVLVCVEYCQFSGVSSGQGTQINCLTGKNDQNGFFRQYEKYLGFFFNCWITFEKSLKGKNSIQLRYLVRSIFRIFQQVFPYSKNHYSGSPPLQHTDHIFLILPKAEPKRIMNLNIMYESALEIPNFF